MGFRTNLTEFDKLYGVIDRSVKYTLTNAKLEEPIDGDMTEYLAELYLLALDDTEGNINKDEFLLKYEELDKKFKIFGGKHSTKK